MTRGRKQVAHLDAPIDVPWVLPEDWRWERLGNIADLIRGVSYKKGQAVAQPCSGHLPLLRGNNIQHGELLFEDLVHVDTTCVSEVQRLEEGDIVLTMSSGSAALVGKSAIVRAVKGPITFGAFCACIRAHAKEDASWIYAFLQTDFYRTLISASAKGTNINNLKREDLLMLPLPVPPLATERRIVARIDELFTELDDGEAALERARDDLETYRKSLLKAAVTGELTADWRAANPPQETGEQLLKRILAERKAKWISDPKRNAKKYREPAGPDSGPSNPIPAGWAWATLDQLGIVENGQTPKGIAELTSDLGEVPWFKVSSMNLPGNERLLMDSQWWVSAADAQSVGLSIRPQGTIVFPKRGGAIMTNKKRLLGREGAFDLNVMGYVPARSHKDYCWVLFQNLDLSLICDGSNVPQINHSDIASIALAVPPEREAELIGLLVNNALAEAEDASKAYQDMQSRSSLLRQSILSAAFKGELVQ